MTPLIFLVALVAGYLVFLAVMAWWPKLRHRHLARIGEERAADMRTAWKRMDSGMWTGGRRS